MKIFYKYLLAAIAIAGIFISCEPDEPDCYEPNNVRCNLAFVRKQLDADTDTVQGRVIINYTESFFDTFMISPRATLLQDSGAGLVITGINTNVLPVVLNPDKNHIAYKIQLDTTVPEFDTVDIFYHSTLHFISNSCGYTYYFGLDSMRSTYNYLDSSYIFNPSVTNTASDLHVKLCLFPQ